jgi:hypothetical protein
MVGLYNVCVCVCVSSATVCGIYMTYSGVWLIFSHCVSVTHL